MGSTERDWERSTYSGTHRDTIHYAVNKRRKSSSSWCDRILMRLGVSRPFRKQETGKREASGDVEKAVCTYDIKLG